MSIKSIEYPKVIFFIFIVCGITSCADRIPGWEWYKPRPAFMRGVGNLPKDSDYTKGFSDGCQAQLSLTGGATAWLPSTFDGWKLTGKSPNGGPHPEIKDAALYRVGFSDGYEQCFYYYDWESI